MADPYPHPVRNTKYPTICSVETLISGVQQNPEFIYRKLADIIQERDKLRTETTKLRADLASVTGDYEGAKRDWKSTREKFEQLLEIGVAKQTLLWRFIERLKSEDGTVEIDGKGRIGKWRGEKSEPEQLEQISEDKRVLIDAGDPEEVRAMENEVERSGEMGTQNGGSENGESENFQSPVTAMSELSGLTLEVSKNLSDGIEENGTNDVSKLDPNAHPFIPSPCSTFSEFFHSLDKTPPSNFSDDKGSVLGLSLTTSSTPHQDPGEEDQAIFTMTPQNDEELHSHSEIPHLILEDSATFNQMKSPDMSPSRSSKSKPYGKEHVALNQQHSQNLSDPELHCSTSPEMSKATPPLITKTPQSSADKHSVPAVPLQFAINIASNLPPQLSNICPNSLLYPEPCNVPKCTLVALCDAYNQFPDGCPLRAEECKRAHIYRSCLEEIDISKCHWWEKGPKKETRKKHFATTAHRTTVSAEEWQGRVVSASLRAAHRRGDWGTDA